MTSTDATSKMENTSSNEATTSTPSLLGLPVELRDIIYSHVIFRPEWPTEGFVRCSCNDPFGDIGRCAVHCPNPLRGRLAYRAPLDKLTQRQTVYLTPSITATSEFQLIYPSPLSFTNKQLREDFFRFLQTAPLNVVARAYDFDFRHIVQFLSRLGGTHQDDFRVRYDGTSARKLIIELHGSYTESYMANLREWFEQVHKFVGPGKHAELAALYKIIPKTQLAVHDKHSINPLVDVGRNFNELIAPGPGEVEACKIRDTLNASEDLRVHYKWWLSPRCPDPRLLAAGDCTIYTRD